MSNHEQHLAEYLEDFRTNEHLQGSIAATLDLFAVTCSAFAEDRGFTEDHEQIQQLLIGTNQSKELCQWFQDTALQAEIGRIMSEGGEAIEAVRKPHADEHLPEFDNLVVELADILIRVGDCAGRRNLHLGKATVAKLLYNLSRSEKHGKSS